MIKDNKYHSAIIIPVLAILISVSSGYVYFFLHQEEEVIKHTESIFYEGERCDPAPYNGHCRSFISYIEARKKHGAEALNQIDY